MERNVWGVAPEKERYRYFESFPFFRKSNDYHEDYAFYFVETGSFEYRIGNAVPEIINSGEVVICPPKTNFSKKVIECVTMHLVNISFKVLHTEIPCGRFSYSDNVRINETLNHLRGIISQKDIPTDRYRAHLIDDLWYSLLARLESPFVRYECHTEDPFFHELSSYVDVHLDTSLAELAQAFSCSRVTINKVFKKHTGKTVCEYIRKARIFRACELITETSEPFKTLAVMCGFSNEYYFSSVFRSVTGHTPGEYRKMCRTR